jgi:uncharacterized protein (TIGR03083 family)
MATADIWPVIHAERRSLATDLAALSAEAWATASLCQQWSVRDVTAHMTATAKVSPATFFPKMLAAGFSLTRMQDKDIAVQKGGTPADTLVRFEGVMDSTQHPPGPADTMLGETIVHAEDIRRPLGIRHEYPASALVQVANFYRGSNLIIGTKRRIAGLTLRSTDTDWSHGSGPEVAGPMLSLVMAMTGRKAALSDLTGDGVAALQARP